MATPLSISTPTPTPTHGDKGVGTASTHALVSRALVLLLEQGRRRPLTWRLIEDPKLKSAGFNADLILLVPSRGKLEETKARECEANLNQCDVNDAQDQPLIRALAFGDMLT